MGATRSRRLKTGILLLATCALLALDFARPPRDQLALWLGRVATGTLPW